MWCRDNAPHMEEMTFILQMQKMHPVPSSSTEAHWLAIKTLKPETGGQGAMARIKRVGKKTKKEGVEI